MLGEVFTTTSADIEAIHQKGVHIEIIDNKVTSNILDFLPHGSVLISICWNSDTEYQIGLSANGAGAVYFRKRSSSTWNIWKVFQLSNVS